VGRTHVEEIQVPNKAGFYGWKLVAVLFTLDFINMGFPYYGGTFINSYMIHEIRMTRGMLGFGVTLLNLFVGLAAVLVAMSILKFGIRATFIAGSAIVCFGSLLMAFWVTKPWQYLIAFGVVNGVGMSFATLVPAATAVSRWFRRYRGRAMGIALSASGFAGLGVSPFLDKMLRTAGGNWRAGWYIVAGAVIVAALIAFAFVKESPESLGQSVDGISEEAQNQPSRTDALATKFPWTAGQAYGTSAYWLIAIAGITTTFPFFLFVGHWVLLLRGVGISSASAALAMGVFTMGTLVGRWFGGLLMDVMNSRLVFALGLLIYFIGSYFAITVRADALMVMYLASVLYGVAYGWTFSCISTITAHYYGPAAFPKLYGTMTLLISACASPAGYVGGKIFDLYGNYTRAIELNCAMAAIGIIAIAFADMPKPRSEVAAPVLQQEVAR
jgi:MFS family permease